MADPLEPGVSGNIPTRLLIDRLLTDSAERGSWMGFLRACHQTHTSGPNQDV